MPRAKRERIGIACSDNVVLVGARVERMIFRLFVERTSFATFVR